MADFVFNVAKGKGAEKVADVPANIGILLLKVAESDAAMKDRTTITDVKSASTEADFTNYARKTAITGTVVIDQAGDKVNITIPNQTWTAAGGGVNNNLVKMVIFYEEAAADGTRIPLIAFDAVITTTGTDIVTNFPSEGIYRAA